MDEPFCPSRRNAIPLPAAAMMASRPTAETTITTRCLARIARTSRSIAAMIRSSPSTACSASSGPFEKASLTPPLAGVM